MSYCLNPNCLSPQNPDDVERCQRCQSRLLLNDRYRPLEPMGRGGFGRTFKARDEYKPSKPNCVIKQFHGKGFPDDPAKAEELFHREAELQEKLGKHPQIPELFALCPQDDYLYLVQEFIDGRNLNQELQKGVDWQKEIRDKLENRDISEELIEALTKLLQPDISQRYQSAEDVLQSLAKPEIEITSTSPSSLLLLDKTLKLLYRDIFFESASFYWRNFYQFLVAKLLIRHDLHKLALIFVCSEYSKINDQALTVGYKLKEAYVTKLTLQTEDYKKALLAISGKMPDSYKRMLVAHYYAPSQVITAFQLAEAAQYKSFEGANLQYGKIGKLIAQYCNYIPPSHTGKDLPFWSIILANGYQDEKNKWYWALRPQVAQALEELGWV